MEQHHDVICGGGEASIRAPAKAVIAVQREDADLRKLRLQKRHAAVGGGIVDYQNFIARIRGESFDNRRKVLGQQVAAIPVRDHHSRGGVVGRLVCGLSFVPEQAPDQVTEQQGQSRDEGEYRRQKSDRQYRQEPE